jgi:acetyltransferase-like isoleucine patch superfamily enzyme
MINPPIARVIGRLRSLDSKWRIALARATGAQIATNCTLGAGTDINLGIASPRRGRITIGEYTELCQGVILHPYGGSIVIGRRVFVGAYTVVFGHGSVEIGDNTLIAMHCRIVAANHAIPPLGLLINTAGDIAKPIRIGRDVWLGAGVTVLAGVTLGDGCIIGAGAVVTHDIPPGAIAHGVPARIVGTRASAG